ncbi:hypothetical protein LINPERPRIM_LOCUS17505 [Linum perenne]
MPRTINAEKPQPQVTEEQGAKSIGEDKESDDCEFLISHRVPPIQRGNHPQSSFRNSQSEIGGPSSRTRAKVTGCATTKTSNMHDEALKDTAEGAGKEKVSVDVTEMAMKAKEKAAGKRKMTADEEHKVRIGSLYLDFLKWAFECYDVNTKVFHFNKNGRLRITEGDVSKVYGLPRGNKSVAKKVAEFKNSDLTELGIDSGLEIENSPREMVLQSVIQRRLENEQDDDKWKKLMILYIIAVLLCPKERLQASLKFLPLLEKDCVGEFTSYNWCKYVVDHFHNGFRTAKQNMEKKGTAAMFVSADINLLMWLHMARRVIDDEISIVKESMELKMEEDKATQAERHDHGGNDSSTDMDANKDCEADKRNTVNVNSTTPPNDHCTHVPSKVDHKGDSSKVAPTCRPILPDLQTPQTHAVQNNVWSSPRMTPQFVLGIDEPFTEVNVGSNSPRNAFSPVSKMASMSTPIVMEEGPTVVVVEKVAKKKDYEGRPNRMKQKLKKLVSPYTAIKYDKRGKAVKVKRDPLPPFSNITPFEWKTINYARDKKMPEGEHLRTRTSIDISLRRLDMVTLNYNEQVSTNVIDEYTHILNLQQMIVFKGRPKRWACSLSMAGCVHADIKKEEIPIDQLFNGLLDTLDVKEALMETEFSGTSVVWFYP